MDERGARRCDLPRQRIEGSDGQHHAEMWHWYVMAVDTVAPCVAAVPGDMMHHQLMTEKVEIDPPVGRAPFGATHRPAIESARGGKVVDRDGEVEGAQVHRASIIAQKAAGEGGGGRLQRGAMPTSTNLPPRSLIARRPRLAALAAGAVSATGFAPLSLWPLTVAAFALLLHLLGMATSKRRAFALGYVFALGHFTVGLNWIAHAFAFQAAMPASLGYVAVVLLSVYLALYPALATLAAWLAWRNLRNGASPGADRWTLVLLLAATWIACEWLRSWAFTGFAWNPLGASLITTALPGLATVIGTYGLAALVILLAGLLVEGVTALARRRAARLPLLTAGHAIVAMFALVFLGPVLIGQRVPGWFSAAPQPDRGVPITIVQPNIGQGDKWDLAKRADHFRKLARLSARVADPAPRLLLWPEAAVPDYLEDGYPLDWYIDAPSFVRARLARLLGRQDVLLTGAVKLIPNADRSDIVAANNSVFSLTGAARLGPRYDKAHLVPYGEYLPMRDILSRIGLSRLAPGAVDFLPGPGPRTVNLARISPLQVKVGVQVCYEIIFSGQVVDRADRPDVLFNPSNDAWFGAWGPPQHLAQARLRAIEEGLPVIRSTPTGISAIIDASGRVTRSIPMGRAGRIDARIPAANAPTPFARLGNVLPLAFAALLATLAVAIGLRQRYRRT